MQEKKSRHIYEGETMRIKIPTHTPKGKKIKTIGVWDSGVADSTILFYMLCKEVQEKNLNIRIQPYTTRRPRPTNPIHAAFVIDKIEEILEYEMLPHIAYYPPLDDPDYVNGKFFSDMAIKVLKDDDVQLIFSGCTMNPPQDIQRTFRDGVNGEEHYRGQNVEREHEHYYPQEDYEFWQIDPFMDLDKSDIAQLYIDNDVLEELFPLTRSCESDDSLQEHCGECWWCEERMWAFGRLI